MLDKKHNFSDNIFYSSLSNTDLKNLKYVFRLSREAFLEFYDRLDEYEKDYLESLIYTHRLDMFDNQFNRRFKLDPMVIELIDRIKDKKDV